MCGIAGFFGEKPFLNQQTLALQGAVLQHRGPDAEGNWLDAPVGFGMVHRRLSIIDLSDAANQPMHSQNGRYVIAYNGEVYNFEAIRKELGLSTQTTSDTEVVLEAFVKWGTGFVKQLNGMFAFVIYDKQNKVAYFFRDRLGIKPLYYYFDGEVCLFSSELKGITAIPEIKSRLKINHQAIKSFLHLGYVPEGESVYHGVYKFPAGHYGSLDAQKTWQVHPYWQSKDCLLPHVVSDETQAKATLKNLIEESVATRLRSDVPYGAFLSGGIDSSLVAAVAALKATQTINTFSIGFEGSPKDESKYAKQVAQYLDTHHTEYILNEKEALPLLEAILTAYDEPFADTSAVPTMLVASLAKRNVSMVLTGDGGDELFHGYGMYDWAARLHHPITGMLRWPVQKALRWGNQRMQRAANLFDTIPASDVRTHIFSQEQYLFSNTQLQEALTTYHETTDPCFSYKDPAPVRKFTPAELQAFFDLNHYLKDDLLVKVDRATMKYGLEARVPLLDHRLVSWALNLHPGLKRRGKEKKYLLKQVLYDYVPAHFFQRPKWGFSIPLAQWLKGELRYLIDDYLNDKVVEEAGIFDRGYTRQLVKRFTEGQDYHYNKIWSMAMLMKWIKANG